MKMIDHTQLLRDYAKFIRDGELAYMNLLIRIMEKLVVARS